MGARATWTAIATCVSCLGLTARADALGVLQAAGGSSEVRAHRIVLSVSPSRTVLWDEFSYTGAPRDFLWLYPVGPGSTFEVGNAAWFDTLEAVTRTRVSELAAQCVDVDRSGCACGEPEPVPYTPYDPSPEPPIQVTRTNTVGPYRTNIISSSEPGALHEYVAQGGFSISPAAESAISAYMAEGFDFLAVSLRPTTSTPDLKPIRVVSPGGAPVLPIRMMAAGAAPVVNVELYVIAEGRQAIPELSEVFLRAGALTWDATARVSNYEALESDALAENDGQSFFTAFASGDPFAMRQSYPNGAEVRFAMSGGSVLYTLSDLYFAQGRLEAATAAPPCPSIPVLLRSDLEVADGPAGQEQLDSGLFACGPMVDLQQALIGQRPARTWLTRLDLELRAENLLQDFQVVPHSDGSVVLPGREPAVLVNAPEACSEPIFTSSVVRRTRVRPFGWGMVPLLVVAAVLRRRLRRGRGAS